MDKEATNQMPISSLSPDEAVVPTPPSMAGDFQQVQDLIKRIVDILQIPLEEVRDSRLKLLDIPQSGAHSRAALPISKALLDPAKAV